MGSKMCTQFIQVALLAQDIMIGSDIIAKIGSAEHAKQTLKRKA